MKSQQGPNMDVGPDRFKTIFCFLGTAYLSRVQCRAIFKNKTKMTKFCPESAGARLRQIRSEESESESRGSRKRTVKHTVKHREIVDQAMPLKRNGKNQNNEKIVGMKCPKIGDIKVMIILMMMIQYTLLDFGAPFHQTNPYVRCHFTSCRAHGFQALQVSW